MDPPNDTLRRYYSYSCFIGQARGHILIRLENSKASNKPKRFSVLHSPACYEERMPPHSTEGEVGTWRSRLQSPSLVNPGSRAWCSGSQKPTCCSHYLPKVLSFWEKKYLFFNMLGKWIHLLRMLSVYFWILVNLAWTPESSRKQLLTHLFYWLAPSREWKQGERKKESPVPPAFLTRTISPAPITDTCTHAASSASVNNRPGQNCQNPSF